MPLRPSSEATRADGRRRARRARGSGTAPVPQDGSPRSDVLVADDTPGDRVTAWFPDGATEIRDMITDDYHRDVQEEFRAFGVANYHLCGGGTAAD
ncbi:hypothetical protein GCM10010293_69100 [Streptomyces griseoflavus]|nr:hypothetical protein GCM10010293_69100 [Streptomyces griseoflavus]